MTRYETVDVNLTIKDVDFNVRVEFSVFGEHRAATWEDPEEFLELEVHSVTALNVVTGAPTKRTFDFEGQERADFETRVLRAIEAANEPSY